MNNICEKCNYKKETELHPLANKNLCVNFNPDKLGCFQKLTQRVNYAISTFFNAIILKGDKHKQAKLNADQVLKIRQMLNSKDYKLKDIAAEFNVTISAIYAIKHNKSWQHLRD